MNTESMNARLLPTVATITLFALSSSSVPLRAAGAPAMFIPAQSATLEPISAAGGAVTALAWDGELGYAGIGTRVAAYSVSPAAIVAWSEPATDVAESISAAAGTVAVRVAAGAGRDIRILSRRGDRLTLEGLIPGALLDQPFHGMALSPTADMLYVVTAGVLEARSLPTGDPVAGLRLPGVRGRPAAGHGFILVGNADGGLSVVAPTVAMAGLPGYFHIVGSVAGPDLDDVLLVAPDRALAIARGEAPGAQVIAYDLADPRAPVEVGRVPLAAGAAFGALGTRAVASWSGSGRIQALAGSGPVPLPRGVVTAHVPLAAVMAADVGLVGAAEGLFSLHAADPDAPSLVAGPFVGAGMAQAVAWVGDTAVVAQGNGLTTFSAGGPELVPLGSAGRPGLAGGLTADLTNGSRSLALGGSGAAYVAAGDTGLLTYDIGDPAAPALAAHLRADQIGGPAVAVAAAHDTVYVGGAGTVRWMDAVVPLAPVLGGAIAVAGSAHSIAVGADHLLVVADGRLFVAALVDGTPGALVPHPAIEQAEAVAADGDLAVVVAGAKMFALDLTGDPLPVITAQLALPESGLTIHLAGSRAWVATPGMVIVADMSAPARVVAQRPVHPGSARALAGRESGVLVAGGFRGLQRLELSTGPEPTPTPGHVLWLPSVLKGVRAGLTSP